MDIFNKVTMHKLIQIVLVGLILVSCVLGAFGAITFAPPAIIVSTLVILVFSIASNKALAWAYGIRSDYNSASITGLILALVLMPTLEPLGLAMLGLIAVIAQATKYVLTYHGRHIFNPVAAGLVIAGTVGLGYASWWVASPPMVAFTLVGAAAVLHKTRLVSMGLVFFVISGTIITLLGVKSGTAVTDAALLVLTSWPVLFFVGFMLTEPTTLPPRRWQKYLVASLVAILFALPFSIGTFSSTPAFALIVGNAVAFMFGQRRAIILKLQSVTSLTQSSKEFIFAPTRPLRFTPGQYIDIFLPHTKADARASRRSFSLTSVPESPTVSLGIRFNEVNSSFKNALGALKPGETIAASTVNGDFVLPRDTKQKILLIAGGIGITPFISQLRTLTAHDEKRDIILLYLARSEQDVAYRTDIEKIPHHIVTGDTRLTADLLTELVPDAAERTAYVSGPPAMVRNVSLAAHDAGVKKVKKDFFSGY